LHTSEITIAEGIDALPRQLEAPEARQPRDLRHGFAPAPLADEVERSRGYARLASRFAISVI
jgi:hypothetical protein